MKNTSMGVHTFAFFQRETADNYFTLNEHFRDYARETGELNSRPIRDKQDRIVGWEYTYKNKKGIKWLLISKDIGRRFDIHGVLVVITPKVLLEDNYIAVARAADLEKIEEVFNSEATKISPILRKFGLCSLNRGDPGLTFDLDDLGIPCSPEQMMKLCKRGDIPKHFAERKVYGDNDKSNRRKADKDSFYLESGSVVINCYWKYPKQNEKHPNYRSRDKSRDVIRFEVQCKYPKLYSISKRVGRNSKYDDLVTKIFEDMDDWEMIESRISYPVIPIDVMLSDEISAGVIRGYFNRVIRKGDYLTLDCARWMVEAHNFRRDKEERLIFALEQVNECRGIAKAKAKLRGVDLSEFKRSLKDLDAILVNPVTIPREWKIDHIPNPLRAYYDNIAEERLVFNNERLFEKFLSEYVSKETRR
jgi:hypothetical protein